MHDSLETYCQGHLVSGTLGMQLIFFFFSEKVGT